jgi:serine/threonine protein kinase
MPFTLSDFTDIKELAKGGMGKIYLATQVSLNRKVVIKEMAGGLLTSKNEIKRFENEAQAGAALNHDNIVRIYDFGEEKGSFYIAMEFIDGPDLDQLLKQNDFPREIGMMILHQALKGLAYAHEHGIVHRDVKPANMLISSHGAVKMVDFGLAYAGTQSGQLTTTGAIVGTPPYMSPELVSGEETRDQCMDIWAAGVILYRLVTGDFPFAGDNVATTLISIMQNKEKAAEEIDPTLSPRIAELLRSCLTKDHTKRLPGLSPLIEALQNHFFEIGILDPVDTIRKYLADKSGTLADIRSHLVRYHLVKGEECSKTMRFSAARAHLLEAKKLDPKNRELVRALRSLEDYMGNALTGETVTVEKAMVTQVRASRTRKGTRGAPVFLTVLIVLSLVLLTAVAAAFYKPRLWNRLSGKVEAVASGGYRTAQSAIGWAQEQIRPSSIFSQPEARGANGRPSAVGARGDDVPRVDKKEYLAKAVDPAGFRRPDSGLRWGGDSGAAQTAGPFAAQGMVRVEITPPTASVKVDNRALTQQEMGGTLLAGGVHQFLASAEGFAPSTTSVAVSGNDTHLVMIGLTKEKKTGELDILSDISAELYIDGEFKGNAPTAGPIVLTEGDHVVTFKRPGFKPYEKTVTIKAGEPRQIKVESGSKSAEN